MKLRNIDSSRLPEIADSVKECVNLGEWLLFKTGPHENGGEMSFFLKTTKGVFQLSDSGQILREVAEGGERLEIDELFYFSDIRKPISLSNMRL